MRLASWVAVGVVAFGFASSASAQNSNFPSRNFTPSNLSSALTGVKPADMQFRTPDGQTLARGAVPAATNVSGSRFSIGNLFPRLSGNSVTKGPLRPSSSSAGVPNSGSVFRPVAPVMSTVDNPGRAISILGSASGVRGNSFQLPTPITGR